MFAAGDYEGEADGGMICLKQKTRRMFPPVRFFKRNRKEQKKILAGFFVRLAFLPFHLLPVKKNRVTFLSNRSGQLSGNLLEVEQCLRANRPDVEICTLTRKEGVHGIHLSTVWQFFLLYATSSVVLVDDYYHLISYAGKKKKVRLIQVWHACGAGKMFGFSRMGKDSMLEQSSPNHRQYDYAIATSERVCDFYAEAFAMPKDRILPLGAPRTDRLTDAQYIAGCKEKLYAAYPVLSGRRVLLFAPTFRGNGHGDCTYPMERFDLQTLFDRIGEEYVVAIKLHPYLTQGPTVPKQYAERVVDLSDEDINEVLCVTDVLVTDYSSVMYEAAILNIPMLFYAFDLEQYLEDRDFYMDYAGSVPGKIVTTMDEMADAVVREDFAIERIAPFRDEMFGRTLGQSTQRVTQLVEYLLE
jgi:CDP-ribitol ribitolphosphotransferase